MDFGKDCNSKVDRGYLKIVCMCLAKNKGIKYLIFLWNSTNHLKQIKQNDHIIIAQDLNARIGNIIDNELMGHMVNQP